MPEPVDGPAAIAWAAYWAPKVAKELDLLREWLYGEPLAMKEISLALPILAGLWTREIEADKRKTQMVLPISLESFKKMNEG